MTAVTRYDLEVTTQEQRLQELVEKALDFSELYASLERAENLLHQEEEQSFEIEII